MSPRFLFLILVLALLCGCGSERNLEPAPLALLSAFPAELVPLLERATVTETIEIEGRIFRVGSLAGRPVILALTGIGLRNAENTTRILLENFEVEGIVVSAVAGSTRRIGDVVVPERWTFADGSSFPVDPQWLATTQALASGDALELQHCTERPNAPEREPVCLAFEPGLFVGGVGQSTDPFGSTPFACQPGGGEVFGCDVELPGASQTVSAAEVAVEPIASDMETAAVLREAFARGVRFIAFRGVSDGEGDPLHLPGFPAQFLMYYRLAARNAAMAAVTFLEALAH